MLDEKDMSHTKFKRVNENTGKEVLWENIVKGYKLDDQYVVLDDEDFVSASPEKSKTIEINEFVFENEIDGIYFETPYYLSPEKSGTRPYALLRDALAKTGKCGIGTYVLRTREHIALVKPLGELLILNKLRFGEEIRNTEEIAPPKTTIKPAEMKMAIELIDQLTTEFDISKYKDEYTGKLLKLIHAKAKGKKIEAPQMRVVHSETTDLMSQLKASLGSQKKKAG
jgi:DNA end-binding protein Ku